jgi:signal transduction histidine kinase
VRQAATEVLLHGAPFICDLEDPAERHNYVATLSQVAVCGETPGGLVIRAVDVTGVCRPARVEARLMGVAAHEMRTPLTSILGYSELLVEHTDRGEPVHRYAAAVHRQAQRLEAIVEELLAVTRLEAGREALTLEPVDMAAVVRHVVLSARPMARDHGVAVTVHAETGRAVVRGDALKLERVVANLVTNAIKYGGPGASVRVTVERNGDRVLVAVADTGCGISEQDAPHVFEKFYRARSPQALAVPGTGLGLAIVKLIVEAHEGDTALHTVVGAGSTFTVSLPVSGPRRHEASTAA